MIGWKQTKLNEIAEIIMGQSPKSDNYNNTGEGLPFLQGNRTFGDRYPEIDTYTTQITRIAKQNDIIMSVRAPVGELNIAPCELCLGRGVCAIRSKENQQNFLFYLMKDCVSRLKKMESGTIFGSVNKNDIEQLDVLIPSAPEQEKIASILLSLDEKIELNNKINDNLSYILT